MESDDGGVNGRPVERRECYFYQGEREIIPPLEIHFLFSHRDQYETPFFFPFPNERKTSKSLQDWRGEFCIITSAVFYSVKTPTFRAPE